MIKLSSIERTGWTEKFSYYGGDFISSDTLAFTVGRDELLEQKVANTIIYSWNGKELTKEGYTITGVAICAAKVPKKEVILIGRSGDIRAGKIGALEAEAKIVIDSMDKKFGYLTNARTIAGRVHVCGMDRQVYRRAKKGWEALDEGLPMGGEGEAVGLRAIDGFSANELYAVGIDGEIWHFDGRRWRNCPSPTGLILHGVHCADDGFVYACGQLGMILKGKGDEWTILEHASEIEDLWDITSFKGVVYAMSSRVLYAVGRRNLVPVEYGEVATPFSFYRFACSESLLVTIGPKDVMIFDGEAWGRID